MKCLYVLSDLLLKEQHNRSFLFILNHLCFSDKLFLLFFSGVCLSYDNEESRHNYISLFMKQSPNSLRSARGLLLHTIVPKEGPLLPSGIVLAALQSEHNFAQTFKGPSFAVSTEGSTIPMPP